MDGITLETAVNSIASGARTATRFMPEPFSQGVDFVQSLARAGLGVSGIGDSPESIINQQIELQQEMLQITLYSNLERTKHETKMAPARNIRLG